MKTHLILWGALSLGLMASSAMAEPLRLSVDLGGNAGPYMGARLELAQDRRRDDERERYKGLDQAIKMVLKRTGGSFVSAEPINEDVYRVVVRIGNRIVAYRVNVRNGSMDEE